MTPTTEYPVLKELMSVARDKGMCVELVAGDEVHGAAEKRYRDIVAVRLSMRSKPKDKPLAAEPTPHGLRSIDDAALDLLKAIR